MKIMVVFSHEKGGRTLLENATDNIEGSVPTTAELMSIKRRLRMCGGYEHVKLLNWFEVKE